MLARSCHARRGHVRHTARDPGVPTLALVRRPAGARRADARGAGGVVLRLPGTQRRRQEHDDQHPHRAPGPGRRLRPRAGPGRRDAGARDQAQDRRSAGRPAPLRAAHGPGAPALRRRGARPLGRRGAPPRGTAAGGDGPHERRGQARLQLLPRHAQEAGALVRLDPRATAPLPRRAVRGDRCRGHARAARPAPEAGRHASADGVPHLARAGSGGEAVHARGHPRAGPARSLRHARGDAPRSRRRPALARGDVHGHRRRRSRRRRGRARLAHPRDRPRVRTLRLLFWLRWRIALNTTSKRGRWAVVAITTLFALALSPIYVGGAIGAHALAAREGAPALLVVFGICQFGIMWMSLLTGAMGRTFELDKLKRYPLRSRDVFAINTIASLTEPIVVMTMPALLAAAFGVARHSGDGAGFAALAAGALPLLVTGAILQLLLALLDDLLRREWMRYVAAFFFTFTILGVQVALRGSSAQLAKQMKQAGFTPDKLIAAAEQTFGRIPTMAAPASVARAQPAGFLHSPLAGLAAAALLIAVPWALGARIMGRAALRAPVGGTLRMRESAGARGSLAPRLPVLSRTQSLLVAREILYMLRTPALLYQLAVVPLSAVALLFLASSRSSAVGPFLPLFVVVGTLAGRNLMLWGFDGPGIRTLFLLPVSARELVLTK